MDPVSSPLNGDAFGMLTFYLRDSFRHLSRHVPQWFTLTLNHTLEE
jgi:hypothetical protein